MELTVDDEMDQWWDANYGTGFVPDPRDVHHVCPPDSPPCPDCQARQEEEGEREGLW
jgi:hypothetical protein